MLAVLAGLDVPLAEVEAIMARTLAAGEVRVSDLIARLGTFHGKMLRPSLVLMVAEALGSVTDRHLHLGAALELIHTATLIHDDLIDDADTRRGQPTAHTRFGNTTSVLLGDYFYTHAFDVVAQLDEPALMRQLTRTTNVICAGELHQQMAARDLGLSEAEYDRIIHAKTAVLCEMAGACGAIDASPPQRAAAQEYGRLCGMAFQVVDDCLDFSGDAQKVGKSLTTDVERGRMTLPIIRALSLSHGPQRAALERCLASVSSEADVAQAGRLVVEAGGVASALATARGYAAEAQAMLGIFPKGEGQRKLHELAEFIVSRDF
jgi:octaprenyl-diphosphate synthase